MRRFERSEKDEQGAFSLIEAVIIYPVIFMLIFFLIYIGLYIIQLSTLSAYAQKVAVLTAREVSFPGYRDILTNDRYATSAVEADFGEAEEGKNPFEGRVNIDNRVNHVRTRAYRYWYNPLNSSEKQYYEEMLTKLVRRNSILNGKKEGIKVSIKCENYVVTQFIDVKVEQELFDFPVLKYFGIKNPKPSASAKAPVCDTDELVRNTDFIIDSLEILANKLGIDTTKIKSTVKSCLNKLGLV
ncbi:MAG: pilus assembly protein [Lachnospiraceae bacterium]|nr:pilus assembly protein [Lachnospiraceae bacterium]